jgi:hypothetical protein
LWSESEIKKWAYNYKVNEAGRKAHIYELINVIKRAIYLHNPKQQFEPRTIQILSLLLFLDADNKNTARLAQIKTGEGKSIIIAMIAAVKALNGLKVDIVTTSPLLAKRDAENKRSFYEMLSLTVGENSGNTSKKSCYECDVVYGDVNDFQFDILRDEYSLLGTRCDRKYEMAIVDEVDSMLIDDNSKICRLSSKMPAMEELELVLAMIWQELDRIMKRIVRIENKIYCVTVPFKYDENGQIVLLKEESDETDSDFIELENVFTFVNEHLKNYVQNKLLKPNEKGEILLKIPEHLKKFADKQLEKWISNAWHAKYSYNENVDYLISDSSKGFKSIVPIDYQNTGIIQTNTTWSDGLHQFLQLKHKLRVTAENLTTNFLSNVGYFSRYGKKLFGLTGTLGSQHAKNLIKHIYDVDFVLIPPYKFTQFKSFPDLVFKNRKQWLDNCIKSIYVEAKIHQRPVLVICETKADADSINEELIKKDNSLKMKIQMYTRSDNDEKKAVDDEIDAGKIIIATNLAGRGTDIGTTHKAELNGGLHVLVTFLPLNLRVEHQAFGRTSRQGKRGTAQLIIYNETEDKIDTLKLEREEKEIREIKACIDKEYEKIKLRDELFFKFCKLRIELRSEEKDEYKLDSVEEQWGFWLKHTLSDEKLNRKNFEKHEKELEEFTNSLKVNYKSNKIFNNPFYLIKKANNLIHNDKNYVAAIPLLEYAISLDSVFSVNARYSLAYALINVKIENKNKAKSELKKAVEIIQDTLIPQQGINLMINLN